MHPKIFRYYERLGRRYLSGGSVLEVGATPDDGSLFNMRCLKGTSRIGLSLVGSEHNGVKIIEANGNDMPFGDEAFDVVLCNSTLEHDLFFWRTASEMRRVLARGGVLLVGVPGYHQSKPMRLVQGIAGRVPGVKRLLNWLPSTTITFVVHYKNNWRDYYRFSRFAVEESIFEGMEILDLRPVMIPPRWIGAARKP